MQQWWQNGKLHRTDGSAIECFNPEGKPEITEYFIDGKKLTYEQWQKKALADKLISNDKQNKPKNMGL